MVQAKTEEELGNACLSVALEVTGSQIGFVNEWALTGYCTILQSATWDGNSALCTTRQGIVVPRAILSSMACMAVSLSTRKASLPTIHSHTPIVPACRHGHPPITSFLGVPLILDGKTMARLQSQTVKVAIARATGRSRSYHAGGDAGSTEEKG